MGKTCMEDGCDHDVYRPMYLDDGYCACHLNPVDIPPDMMEAAIVQVALENDAYDVNVDGEIRMKEGE